MNIRLTNPEGQKTPFTQRAAAWFNGCEMSRHTLARLAQMTHQELTSRGFTADGIIEYKQGGQYGEVVPANAYTTVACYVLDHDDLIMPQHSDFDPKGNVFIHDRNIPGYGMVFSWNDGHPAIRVVDAANRIEVKLEAVADLQGLLNGTFPNGDQLRHIQDRLGAAMTAAVLKSTLSTQGSLSSQTDVERQGDMITVSYRGTFSLSEMLNNPLV